MSLIVIMLEHNPEILIIVHQSSGTVTFEVT